MLKVEAALNGAAFLSKSFDIACFCCTFAISYSKY